jgi:formylglycine-generating enzyme
MRKLILHSSPLLRYAVGVTLLLSVGCSKPVAPPAIELTALITIPDGMYRPLYPGKSEPAEVVLSGFLLEEHAVTNQQFLSFVKINPRWQRSRVRSLFADKGYLQHWVGDVELATDSELSPVTNVSWFAARAYAEWAGRRLPTLAEWEYISMASETSAYGRDEKGYNQLILNWYGKVTPPIPPAVRFRVANFFGVYDMHGLIWEWVDDFNSALVTGESRGNSALDRNLFCGSGSIGSADPSDYAAFMRFAFRSSLEAHYTTRNQGFRCAADLK